jgi:DMSO/TMAO reductase YedYZ molybdopterin-dependent catalytic subunit
MSRRQAAFCGLFSGLIAGLAMTFVMLLLAWKFRLATPLVILGDRLSVFISPKPFFWIMGRVGGYNHLKQFGVCSSALGQIFVGGLGGLVYGLGARTRGRIPYRASLLVFVVLPLTVSALLLWPVLGTHYAGLPIDAARIVTLLGLALSFLAFERTLVITLHFLTTSTEGRASARPKPSIASAENADVQKRVSPSDEFTPQLGRRAFLAGTFGLLLMGGITAIARKLYRMAAFSYDGTQYLGEGVQPITPNEQFYCVTKNVVDPRVKEGLWHLEVSGLIQNPRTYRINDFRAMEMIDQETTLMCISNGLDAGLMSNAIWRGIPMADLLNAAAPLSEAARVKLHGVDNYTDTFPLAKALEPTTLIAFEMNGQPLPHRHGFPARAIVPGYFGEKHVKWLTRIEVTHADARGFYETQGWGPDFIVPTRSRIDVPANETWWKLADAAKGVPMKGVAFGGDRGISRVEVSLDDGENWEKATITYPGTKLSWALWKFDWKPDDADDYILVVRATDGNGEVQKFEEDREFTSGITGFHKVVVHVLA